MVRAAVDRAGRLVYGDAKHSRGCGDSKFRFVYITGNAFQAFLTAADQAALLANVKRHLHAQGVFAFETRNPTGNDLSDIAQEEPWDSFTNTAGQRVTVSGTQHFDATRQLMHWTTFRRWHDGTAPQCTTTRIACKFTAPAALDRLLRRCGFEVTSRFGDWDHAPFTERSEHIICVCRLAVSP